MKLTYAASRYFTALMVMLYAFAKINGTQFAVLEYVKDMPLQELSGFWLTWYYYGYSSVYGTLIALLQIGAAIMLLHPKSTLPGAVMLFFIMSNIFLVDIFYGVDLPATVMAGVLLLCLSHILWEHRETLRKALWDRQPEVAGWNPSSVYGRATKYAVRALVVMVPFLLTYTVIYHNTILHTPLDGGWQVLESRGTGEEESMPERIYFEYNRAYLAVFRYGEKMDRNHFEVDNGDNSLRIWEEWLEKEEQLFSGRYELLGDTLRLTGSWRESGDSLSLTLLRANGRADQSSR